VLIPHTLIIPKTSDRYDLVSVVNADIADPAQAPRVYGSYTYIKQVDPLTGLSTYHLYAPRLAEVQQANGRAYSIASRGDFEYATAQLCIILMYKLIDENDQSKGVIPII
jgi:hypothetical protein